MGFLANRVVFPVGTEEQLKDLLKENNTPQDYYSNY